MSALTSRALRPKQRACTRDTDPQLDSLLAELESILDRIDPIGRAILATMPSTVKAWRFRRDTLHSCSRLLDEPVDKMELHKNAIRY